MSLKDALLPEYDQEMSVTRRVLERVPLAQAGWKPHVKSMTLGELAGHIASIPAFVGNIVKTSSFDIAAQEHNAPPSFATTKELLAAFDQNVAATRAIIESKSDAEMMSPWSFMRGSQVLMTMPKLGVFRTVLLNHVIHHRGQCSVYLRLTGVPVPSIYGPSADESV